MTRQETEWLVSEIEARRLQLCNGYKDFYTVCTAFATDMGEEGREYARRICRLSDNYIKHYKEDGKDFDVQYNSCLKNSRGTCHLASVFKLAKDAGIDLSACPRERTGARDTKSPQYMITNSTNNQTTNNMKTTNNTNRVNGANNAYYGNQGNSYTTDADEEDVEVAESSKPLIPTPFLLRPDDELMLPSPLREMVSLQTKQQQKDAVFLSSLMLLLYPVSHITYTIYWGHKYYPTIYALIVGSPASGKGCVGEAIPLMEYLQERKYAAYQKAFEEYKKSRREIANAGKGRTKMEVLEIPKMNVVFVTANATDTANIQAIADCEGHCIVYTPEMSDMVAANEREQGGLQHSSTFRVLFDHDTLEVIRRTNNEHILVTGPKVLTIMAGTDLALTRLIVSAENGQFSRGVYYFLPEERKFENRSGRKIDVKALVKRMGKEWTLMVEKRLAGVQEIVFDLTESQEDAMYETFEQLNDRAFAISNDMVPFVRREVINIKRMMTAYAFVRAMDDWTKYGKESCLLMPDADTNSDNIKDGIVTKYQLQIRDIDFYFILSMAEPLFQHAAHAYSLLQQKEVSSNRLRESELLMNQMPELFDTTLYYKTGEQMGFEYTKMRKWLSRAKKRGIIECVEPCIYKKGKC